MDDDDYDDLRKRRVTKFGPNINLEPFTEVSSKNVEQNSTTRGSEEVLSIGYDTKYTKGHSRTDDSIISSSNQIDNRAQDLHLDELSSAVLLTILSEYSFGVNNPEVQ